MTQRIAFVLIAAAALAPCAEKYTGPRPPKPDIPYLVHADTLLATELVMAREDSRKDDAQAYVVPGATSPVRTPLASPIFLMQSEKIPAEALRLYKFETKSGNREVNFSRKKPKQSARPIRLTLQNLGEGLWKIEVYESLENGEYGLSPDGTNEVFCFSEY